MIKRIVDFFRSIFGFDDKATYVRRVRKNEEVYGVDFSSVINSQINELMVNNDKKNRKTEK